MYILTIKILGKSYNCSDVRECKYSSDAFMYAKAFLSRTRARIKRGMMETMSEGCWRKEQGTWVKSVTAYETKEDTDGTKIILTIAEK
jgi:hypothetical protein